MPVSVQRWAGRIMWKKYPKAINEAELHNQMFANTQPTKTNKQLNKNQTNKQLNKKEKTVTWQHRLSCLVKKRQAKTVSKRRIAAGTVSRQK